jgi:hypothetical protein
MDSFIHPYTQPASAPAAPAAPTAPAVPARRRRRWLFRLLAVVVIAVAGSAVGYLALRHHGGSSSHRGGLNAVAVTPTQLDQLAASLGHPVFWAGPSAGDSYELSRVANGTIFVRYLPAGVALGSSKPYLTIATYPFNGAFTAVENASHQKGATSLPVADGGVAVVTTTYPDSVHVAYPGLSYQVEVYDPTPGAALTLVKNGQLTAFGSLKPPASKVAQIVTADGLRAFAASLDHPIYWLGPRPPSILELTQTGSGRVYIRYLPPGMPAGASQTFLTVATYPFPGAFGALQALARQKGSVKLSLPGGGLAVATSANATSYHVAFPGSDYQVEVFASDPSGVRYVVSSGLVRRVG